MIDVARYQTRALDRLLARRGGERRAGLAVGCVTTRTWRICGAAPARAAPARVAPARVAARSDLRSSPRRMVRRCG